MEPAAHAKRKHGRADRRELQIPLATSASSAVEAASSRRRLSPPLSRRPRLRCAPAHLGSRACDSARRPAPQRSAPSSRGTKLTGRSPRRVSAIGSAEGVGVRSNGSVFCASLPIAQHGRHAQAMLGATTSYAEGSPLPRLRLRDDCYVRCGRSRSVESNCDLTRAARSNLGYECSFGN